MVAIATTTILSVYYYDNVILVVMAVAMVGWLIDYNNNLIFEVMRAALEEL